MKIAVLVEEKLRKELITDQVWKKIQALGEVAALECGCTDERKICEVMRDAQIAVTSWGSPRLDQELLDCAPGLELVAHAAGSVKSIVSDELYDRNIRVVSSARVLSRGVSEMALGLTIAAAKNVFSANEQIHSGEWPKEFSPVNELYEMTVGVVGCGFAGAHYVELLKPFDVRIMVYDPGLDREAIEKLGGEKAELSDLLKESDIISLHAPSIDATYHMINEDSIGLMKDRAILINTARGSLIDEAALAKAMENGKLKYACLDVTDPEPPKADSPLRKLPNCIMTPHVAGLFNNGKYKIGAHVYEEMVRYNQGEALLTEVTKEMLSTIA